MTTIPPDAQRYPTAAEIVRAAVAASDLYGIQPTRDCPHYVVPYEDLDGNSARLVVVPLGGRVALAWPNGDTAVLPYEGVAALSWLEETLIVKVHGGDECMGKVTMTVHNNVTLYDDGAKLSVTATPYRQCAVMTFPPRMPTSARNSSWTTYAVCGRSWSIRAGHDGLAPTENQWHHGPGPIMIKHVLELLAVVDDPNALPEPDRELVETVLEELDSIDHYTITERVDEVAVRNAPGLTATVRALLEPHRRDADGRCTTCPSTMAWPCSAWRVAHRWLFELDPITGTRRQDDRYVVTATAT
jgi:hypothetical protein